MKKIILAILSLVVLASGALYYFVFLNSGPIEIVSEDQQFTLSIPSGSLPEGVSSDDIIIKKLAANEFLDIEAGLDAVAVYRLEPEGTSFDQPIAFELSVDAQDSGFAPSLLHIVGDSVETVSDVQVKKNEDGSFTMKGSIDHFSDIVILDGFFASEMPDDLGTHLVGEPFTVTVTMKKRNDYWLEDGTNAHLEGNPEFVGGGGFVASKILSPAEIMDKPADGTPFDSDTMSFDGEFTCEETGYAQIQYISGVFYDYNFYWDGITAPMNVFNYIFPAFLYDGEDFVESAFVHCVEPSAEELEKHFTYRVNTVCGTSEVNGRLEIIGTLLYGNVKGVKVRIGDKIYTPDWDPTTGIFYIGEDLHPGTYGFGVTAVTTLGSEIMVQRYGAVEVPWCPENTEDSSTQDDPVIYIDPVLDEPTEPVSVDSSAGICEIPENDSCSNPAQYGFPVCDEANLPLECRPTDTRPGWDCYTFEESACEPSTRCFCITPPENLQEN